MTKGCSVQGCLAKHVARGFRASHYKRWKRDGDPGPVVDPNDNRASTRKGPEAIFWQSVRKTNSCWEWVGITRSGYGMFSAHVARNQRRYWLAHRFSWELAHGSIPSGLVLDHLCRNTICVNPAHLEAVTQLVNVRRGESPGAITSRTNQCKRGHEFTEANTIRRPGAFGRQCRECGRLRDAARSQERNRAAIAEGESALETWSDGGDAS